MTKEDRLKEAEQATEKAVNSEIIEKDDRILIEFNGHRIPLEADELISQHGWLISSRTTSSEGLVLYTMFD